MFIARSLAVPDKWNWDPFGATLLPNGDIVARGSQDMKSVCIQHLAAVLRLVARGKKLLRTINLSFVPDEEIGGGFALMRIA